MDIVVEVQGVLGDDCIRPVAGDAALGAEVDERPIELLHAPPERVDRVVGVYRRALEVSEAPEPEEGFRGAVEVRAED